ncbi:MAG: peptidoglycan DD-metalloendopeptidase family protein, partial [Clostridia bacterium]|nr:peptidoglycan DD-metalloendopeptidase family protein [Clostridia bacterium]
MVYRLGFNPDTLAVETGQIKSGDYFTNWMTKLGMNSGDAYKLSVAVDTVFDVKKLRSGNAWQAYYSFDADSVKTLEYVVYERDRETDVVFRCREPLAAAISEKPVETHTKYAEVTIDHSLWEDMMHEHLTPLLILKLSDIYAWTIDFFALQKGDSFRVCYDEKMCDGKTVSVDTVRFASFIHGNSDFRIVMFDQGDDGNIYWNEKGESVRKAFLKAPLNYSRISSGYSTARRHPVTRKVQPHTGVDYAAPTGTPVVAVGDGRVLSAKNEGAGGNVIRIKHNSTYTTAYLHLSKYAAGIRAGATVHQGQVIGYVGATGRVTGPHLDFRVWKNG